MDGDFPSQEITAIIKVMTISADVFFVLFQHTLWMKTMYTFYLSHNTAIRKSLASC